MQSSCLLPPLLSGTVSDQWMLVDLEKNLQTSRGRHFGWYATRTPTLECAGVRDAAIEAAVGEAVMEGCAAVPPEASVGARSRARRF